MQFMLIFANRRGQEIDESVYPEMGKFAQELAAQGKMRGGAPLHPEEQGARVRMTKGKLVVTDGPFTETKEVIGGFFMIEAKDKREAVAIAKRCPHARTGFVEVRRVIPVGGN
jgi:hypothetical protein